MAGTRELARAVDFLTGRGASVRLIGDDQQLAAVGAGGVLRDIAHTVGAVALSQVVRFTDPEWGQAEAAASLALRDGDPAALGFYLDRGRVHVGDLATATEHAYQAWAADRAAGRDAVMLAPTREIVAELNTRARADRLAAAHRARADTDGGRTSGRAGTRGCPGRRDPGQRRRRDHHPPQRPHVAHHRAPTGSRTATGSRSTRSATTARCGCGTWPPAATSPCRPSYVASTSRSATPAPCTPPKASPPTSATLVATGEETRQLLYVGLTRGRDANHVYLAAAGDGDPHTVITRDALLPPTGADILDPDPGPGRLPGLGHQRPPRRRRPGGRARRGRDPLLRRAADRRRPTTSVPERLAAIDAAANATLPGLPRTAGLPDAARPAGAARPRRRRPRLAARAALATNANSAPPSTRPRS